MRAAVDRRETDQGDVREEIVVGNACRGRPGSHGNKGYMVESCIRGRAINIAFPPTFQHGQLNNKEAAPSDA